MSEVIDNLSRINFVNRELNKLLTVGFCYIYDGRNDNKNKHKKMLNILDSLLYHVDPELKYTYTYGCYDHVWCYQITIKKLQ